MRRSAALLVLILIGWSCPAPAQQKVGLEQATGGAAIADISVTNSATLIVGQDGSRLAITCVNNDGANSVRWCGGCTPTASAGVRLRPGAAITDAGTYPITAISETAATVVLSCTRANR